MAIADFKAIAPKLPLFPAIELFVERVQGLAIFLATNRGGKYIIRDRSGAEVGNRTSLIEARRFVSHTISQRVAP